MELDVREMRFNSITHSRQNWEFPWCQRHNDDKVASCQLLVFCLSFEQKTVCFFLTHVPPNASYILRWTGPVLVQVMACRLFDAKPLPEPMLTYCLPGTNFTEIPIGILSFSFRKIHLKLSSAKMATILSMSQQPTDTLSLEIPFVLVMASSHQLNAMGPGNMGSVLQTKLWNWFSWIESSRI